MEWQPIDTAPKDGTLILCWGPGWDYPTFLIWKENRRIVEAHRQGENAELHACYFGDPDESDDYDLATDSGGATLWLSIPHPDA